MKQWYHTTINKRRLQRNNDTTLHFPRVCANGNQIGQYSRPPVWGICPLGPSEFILIWISLYQPPYQYVRSVLRVSNMRIGWIQSTGTVFTEVIFDDSIGQRKWKVQAVLFRFAPAGFLSSASNARLVNLIKSLKQSYLSWIMENILLLPCTRDCS